MDGLNNVNARFARLEPLIDRALELEGSARERFIALCADIYPDLGADLRRALAEDAGLPALGDLAAEVTRGHTAERRGLRVGSWRLEERIGQGGMGSVYRAERADGAFDMQVAIKLLRGEDPRFREQLERERRLLARLDHPGIARLIDGGVLDDGQPWLAMELAAGQDLDLWLASNPPLRARLEVFLSVCDAVASAHEARVVHRDLKPRNIRVTGEGQVKLLDFGIAKLLAQDARAGVTRHLALTPEYAAPEQLGGGVVTPRTDVYALGALLHLLLTGRSPHPPFDGNWAAYADHVRQVDPAPASRSVASPPPAALPAECLRGDLDAIVARALRRDPAQRYESARALAQDVHRHLQDLPVVAHPSTLRYRAGKWRRRHPVAAGLMTILALAACVTLTVALLR